MLITHHTVHVKLYHGPEYLFFLNLETPRLGIKLYISENKLSLSSSKMGRFEEIREHTYRKMCVFISFLVCLCVNAL